MDKKFEENLQRELRSMERSMTRDRLYSLQQARARALDSDSTPWLTKLKHVLWPASGMATACALVLVLLLNTGAETIKGKQSLVRDQALEEQVDLLEDLEFYHWLAEDEKRLRG